MERKVGVTMPKNNNATKWNKQKEVENIAKKTEH